MKKGYIIAAGVVVVILVAVIFLGRGYARYRVNDIGLCKICHELFVPYEDYKGKAPTPAKSVFSVGVGCAECHMQPFEEFKKTPHYQSGADKRPGCNGCHEPHTLLQIVRWKFLYINTGSFGDSPFHALSDSIRDKPEWEELRIKLAKRVREGMLNEGSIRCWNCHQEGFKAPDGDLLKKKIHKRAIEKAKGERLNCVKCHYNLVHAEVAWPEMEKKE